MIFIDANIFMYAVGADSPQRRPCQAFLSGVVADSRRKACTNVEVLQEILHRYASLKISKKGGLLFDDILALGIPILPVQIEDVVSARQILDATPGLSTRDAIHVGVMQSHGISQIATYAKGFKKIPWVQLVPIG